MPTPSSTPSTDRRLTNRESFADPGARSVSEDDKYTYAGSGGVLINSRNIRDQAGLDEAMNGYASVAMAALRAEPIPDRLDADYLQAIHERMFHRLVPGIAGRIRDVDVQATGTGIPYCRPDYIEANLSTLFHKLEREDYLTGLDADTFTERLADRWGELSAIHPYRDGNTRSQSAYITALAERAAHPIDWQSIDVDTLRIHRLQAVAGNDRPLAAYLRNHLVDTDRAASAVQVQPQALSADRNHAASRAARTDGDKPRAADAGPKKLRAPDADLGRAQASSTSEERDRRAERRRAESRQRSRSRDNRGLER